jgi:hypothetical protein
MSNPTTDIAHVIQMAIAPVFLLSSLGTILSVLSTRLGRIVDRTRVLLGLRDGADEVRKVKIEAELKLLVSRRATINRSITFATAAALLVCVLIAVAFMGSLVDVNTGAAVATLFVLAMVAFISSLLFFLREVLVASGTTHTEFH